MNTWIRSSLFLLVALLGCDSATVPDPALVIATDAARYAPSDTVTVAFTNGRATPLLLMSDGCITFGKPLPNARVERLEQERWVRYPLEFGCGAVAQPPTALASNTTYQVQLRVGLMMKLPPGTYRYVFGVTSEEGEQDPVPEEEQTSNAFEVEAPA